MTLFFSPVTGEQKQGSTHISRMHFSHFIYHNGVYVLLLQMEVCSCRDYTAVNRGNMERFFEKKFQTLINSIEQSPSAEGTGR